MRQPFRKFTPDEIEHVRRECIEKGRRPSQVAAEIGRGVDSVRRRTISLGRPVDTANRPRPVRGPDGTVHASIAAAGRAAGICDKAMKQWVAKGHAGWSYAGDVSGLEPSGAELRRRQRAEKARAAKAAGIAVPPQDTTSRFQPPQPPPGLSVSPRTIARMEDLLEGELRQCTAEVLAHALRMRVANPALARVAADMGVQVR